MRNKAKTILQRLTVSAILTTLYCCMADTRHLSFTSIGIEGWNEQDTLTYTITPLRIKGESGISILFHTEGYPYENLSIGITISQDTLIYTQQLEILLNEHNKTKGIGQRYDYIIPVTNLTLCDTLSTSITLTHLLDKPTLTGIREVGILISKPICEKGETVWQVEW